MPTGRVWPDRTRRRALALHAAATDTGVDLARRVPTGRRVLGTVEVGPPAPSAGAADQP